MAAEVKPKLGIEKVIKQRVEAAAEAGQAQRERVEPPHGQLRGAVGHDALGHHQVKQEVDVVGCEADQEEGGAAEDHLQSALLLCVCLLPSKGLRLDAEGRGSGARGAAVLITCLSLLQRAGDEEGAEADAGKRNYKTKQFSKNHHSDRKRDGQATHGQVFKTAELSEEPGSMGAWTHRAGRTYELLV